MTAMRQHDVDWRYGRAGVYVFYPGGDVMRKKEEKQDFSKFYGSARWKKLRKYHINRNPWCVVCLQLGLYTPVEHVDHVTPVQQGGEAFALENLQSLCHIHHNQKTAEDKKRGKT